MSGTDLQTPLNHQGAHAVSPAPDSTHHRFLPGRSLLLLAGVAVISALVLWAYAENSQSGTDTVFTGPRLLEPLELAAMPGVFGHSVFWAGRLPGMKAEFSQDPAGNIRIRYLAQTAGMAGSKTLRSQLVNVTTYPYTGAYAITAALAHSQDLRLVRAHGGIGFLNPKQPYFVVLAWPSSPNIQVKVSSRVPYRALQLVRAGEIVPLP